MPETLSYDLQRTIRLLPGYDPFVQAGDCWFDEGRAGDVLEFIRACCTHVKGRLAGTPLILESWQEAIFANLYGWVRPDGLRRYREALIFVPRGNSKTTMAAAAVCVGLYHDTERGGELYSSAAEREQARLCFEIVAGMIRQDPDMNALATIHKYAIVVGDQSYKAISAEAGSKHGFNAQLIVNDELHAHKTSELTEVLMTSQGKRDQPLCIHLTTSDYEREGSVCNQKHDYASKVRDGVIDDPSFLPVIYEASIEDDWTDPKVWAKANPNLGISVAREYIERECKRAQEQPAYENTFKRLHLNIRTEQACRLLAMDQWDGCSGVVDPKAYLGRDCWAGLDLSTVKDLSALVLCFPGDDETFDFVPFFWCPREEAMRRDKAGIPYLAWAREGLVELTEGNSIDYRFIRQRINELAKTYKIQEIAYDPYNATHLVTELGEEDGHNVVEFRQGMLSMAPPTKLLLRLLRDGKIRHGGNKVLRWNASNVAGRTDHAENVMPSKKDSNEKIDGIVAMLMALGRASSRPVRRKSVYCERGVSWHDL